MKECRIILRNIKCICAKNGKRNLYPNVKYANCTIVSINNFINTYFKSKAIPYIIFLVLA